MPRYRWRIDFLLPGVPIDRPIQLDAIQLQPAPRDGKGHSWCTGHLSLELDQYADENAVKAEVLKRLGFVAIAAAGMGGSVREPIIDSIRLENREELETAGMRTPLSASLCVSFTVVAPTLGERELLKGYRAVSALSPDQLLLWSRAARWLWKANGEQDPYDQMLALWIAFNVVYGPYMNGSERQAIKKYVAHAVGTESAARSLLSLVRIEDLRRLGNSRLTLGKGQALCQIASELQSALGQPAAKQSSVELVKLALLSIYAVRCALVHEGRAAADKGEEVQLVWASAHVLKAVMMYVFRERFGI